MYHRGEPVDDDDRGHALVVSSKRKRLDAGSDIACIDSLEAFFPLLPEDVQQAIIDVNRSKYNADPRGLFQLGTKNGDTLATELEDFQQTSSRVREIVLIARNLCEYVCTLITVHPNLGPSIYRRLSSLSLNARPNNIRLIALERQMGATYKAFMEQV